MRQIIYVSTVAGDPRAVDVEAILATSQRNNRRDGLTGLLYSDGRRFLQALEGESDVVGRAFERIQRDPRHRAIVLLSDRIVPAREFGEWAMAHRRPGGDPEAFIGRVASLVRDASPAVRATFASFAEYRRAA